MITVAIPFWNSDPGKQEVLNKCITSLKGHDNLLVLAGKQPTLPRAWNMCLETAFDAMGSDFVILANDDIVLDKGTLDMLCDEDAILSPTVNNGVFKIFHCHIFCYPRKIYEQIGGFDERFEVYWADTDLAKRFVDANINVGIKDEVNVKHPEAARTLKHYKGRTEQADEMAFRDKFRR